MNTNRDARGRFISQKPRWLHHIDSKPRTWAYLTLVLALGFVQHLAGAVS